MGQSLGAKITQQQAMSKLDPQNQFDQQPLNGLSYNLGREIEPSKSDLSIPSNSSQATKEIEKREKPVNKWNTHSPLTKIPVRQRTPSLDFDFDDELDVKKMEKPSEHVKKSEPNLENSFENLLKSDVTKKTERKHANSEQPVMAKKPSALSAFKDLLDDEEIESLLGKESPSKSRLPHTKTNSRGSDTSLKKRGYGFQQPSRFSPEKRVIPGIGTNRSKPFRPSGLSKLDQKHSANELNTNNNANENAYPTQTHLKDTNRRPLAHKNDVFWSNLFGDESKKKEDSSHILPSIGNTQPFQTTKQAKYV